MKLIFWDNLIIICKLIIPVMNAAISAGHVCNNNGVFIVRYIVAAVITGTDIMYDILSICCGLRLLNDNPNIVVPDLDNPGITDNPCNIPVITDAEESGMFAFIFFL